MSFILHIALFAAFRGVGGSAPTVEVGLGGVEGDTAEAAVDQEVDIEATDLEVVVPASGQPGFGVADVGEFTTFLVRQAAVVEQQVAAAVTGETTDEEVAVRTAFGQLEGVAVVGGVADHEGLDVIVQREDLVAVHADVDVALPDEVAGFHRDEADRGLDTLVLDVTGVHIVGRVTGTGRRGEREQLVARVGLVVLDIERQAVVEQAEIEAGFEGSRQLGFQRAERRRGVGGDGAGVGDGAERVGDAAGQVVTHDGVGSADLEQIHPGRHIEGLVQEDGQTGGRIEETGLEALGESERRRPVVTAGHIEEEPVAEREGCRGEDADQLAPIPAFIGTANRHIVDGKDVGKLELAAAIARVDGGVGAFVVIDARTDRGVEAEVAPVVLIAGQEVGVGGHAGAFARDVLAVLGEDDTGRRGRIGFVGFASCRVVGAGAGLDVDFRGDVPAEGERTHRAVAPVLADDAVGDPVRVLVVVGGKRFVPVLHHQVAVHVVGLELLFVLVEVEVDREVIHTHHRVVVQTAGGRTVLGVLADELHRSVEGDVFGELGGVAERDVVAAQLAGVAQDTVGRRVTVGEVGLVPLVAALDGEAVGERVGRLEEIVGRKHAVGDFRAPALPGSVVSIGVLEFVPIDGVLEIGRAVEGHAGLAGDALLGGDQDDAVGGLGTVQGGSGSTLQDGDALDIVGVEVADTVTVVEGSHTARAVGVTADVGGAAHRHAVDDVERFVAAVDRTETTDGDLRRSTHTGGRLGDRHTGGLTGQGGDHVGCAVAGDFFGGDHLFGIRQGLRRTGDAEGGDHGLFQDVVAVHNDVHDVSSGDFDDDFVIADRREAEGCVGRDVDGVPAVGVGGHRIAGPLLDDRHKGDGFTRLRIFHLSGHTDVLRKGGRRRDQAGQDENEFFKVHNRFVCRLY